MQQPAQIQEIGEQHWFRQHAWGLMLCCCATVSGYRRAVWDAKAHRLKSSRKEGCIQLELQSSTDSGSMHGVLDFVAMQQFQVIAELYGVQDLKGVNAVPKKVVSSLDCRAALVQAACMGSYALLLCSSVRLPQSCMGCKSS